MTYSLFIKSDLKIRLRNIEPKLLKKKKKINFKTELTKDLFILMYYYSKKSLHIREKFLDP